jgi:hypothetical protein
VVKTDFKPRARPTPAQVKAAPVLNPDLAHEAPAKALAKTGTDDWETF